MNHSKQIITLTKPLIRQNLGVGSPLCFTVYVRPKRVQYLHRNNRIYGRIARLDYIYDIKHAA